MLFRDILDIFNDRGQTSFLIQNGIRESPQRGIRIRELHNRERGLLCLNGHRYGALITGRSFLTVGFITLFSNQFVERGLVFPDHPQIYPEDLIIRGLYGEEVLDAVEDGFEISLALPDILLEFPLVREVAKDKLIKRLFS